MTDAQILMLTSNVFLAAWIGNRWINGFLFFAYTILTWLK